MELHSGPILATKNNLSVIACQKCDFTHLWPLPTPIELERLYNDEYYQAYNAGWFDKERREQWYWRRVYERRCAYAAEWMPNSFALDYGAGCGWFVRAASHYGFSVYGYEPNALARKYANVNVTGCVVYTIGNTEEGFIHLSLVLEHILDPLTLLKELHFRLAPGGVMCIVVPNEFNPLQRELTNRFGYSPLHPHHLNYFTQTSLCQLAYHAGFSILRIASTFPMELFALRGLNYVKYPKLGRVAHWLRMLIEWYALTVNPVAWERRRDEWANDGVGREIELWLKKS